MANTPKLYLVCLIQLFFTVSLFAGTDTPDAKAASDKFVIGVDAGPGLSAFYGNANIMPSAGYHRVSPDVSAGVNFQYQINKIFSVGTGAYYNRLGFTQNYFNGTPANTDIHHSLNYVTIPVFARATFGKKVKFFTEAGAYISVLAKPLAIQPAPWLEYLQGENIAYEAPPAFKRLDAGVTLGAGINVPLPRHFALNFEVRNNVGLVNVFTGFRTYSTALLSGFTYTFGKKAKQ